jgi:hypothetical protein
MRILSFIIIITYLLHIIYYENALVYCRNEKRASEWEREREKNFFRTNNVTLAHVHTQHYTLTHRQSEKTSETFLKKQANTFICRGECKPN